MQVQNGPKVLSIAKLFLNPALQHVICKFFVNVCIGHYVPQLAKKIHDYNKALSNTIINLKGFMVSK